MQIFLPLCHGSVKDLLSRRAQSANALPQPRWLPTLAFEVLGALKELHDSGISHRDIKPDNILFTWDATKVYPTFCIADFGLAAKMTAAGITGWTGGTTMYKAPEATRRADYTFASDLYAFGITLLEVQGLYCPHDARISVLAWRRKLSELGVSAYAEYVDSIPFTDVRVRCSPEAQTGHSRIQSLVDYGVLSEPLCRILDQDPTKWPTAVDAQWQWNSYFSGHVNGRSTFD